MENCRACGHTLKNAFLSLGKTPVSNSYLLEAGLHSMEPFYPLELYVCEKCFWVQIDEFEPAENIFSANYAYFSSYSKSWLEHCKNYTDLMISKFNFSSNSLVVEIASNDGYLLQYFKEKNIHVLGIEPTANTAHTAIKKGIPTDIEFFNSKKATSMKNEGKFVDLLIGNNVLAHVPNVQDFVHGLSIALKPNGVITMEFPHLMRLIEFNQFDTIYHEHFSYISLHSVIQLFEKYSLEIFDVDEIPTHGGSLRIYAKHKIDSTKKLSNNVSEILKKEKEAGLLNVDTYIVFNEKVKKTKRDILTLLINLKNENKKIVGYGAPAKGNTLLNYCGVGTDFIDFTVDMSEHKQGKFLPGVQIPILHPDEIKKRKPEYVIVLPWNIKEEIMQQISFIKEWGGKFVICIPNVEVI